MGLITSVKYRRFQVIALVVCLLFFVYFWSRRQPTTTLRTMQINTQTLQVEIADEPEEITLGLSFRSQLGSDGLVFVLPSRTVPAFWMKGMKFPLDFVWIDSNTVVDLTMNVPIQEGATDSELILYRPSVAVTHVLELNAGAIERLKIKVGDSVRLQ